MNPFLSSGTKDIEAASLVIEPLARFDEDGDLVPVRRRGNPDARERRHLRGPDLDHLEDQAGPAVVGRHARHRGGRGVHLAVLHPSRGRLRAGAVLPGRDQRRGRRRPKTVKVTFGVPKPYPYTAFVGAQSPIIQAAQFADCLGAAAPTCTEANTRPIGTGPFVVTDFKANDVVLLEANPNYRDPEKPAFATVVLKGGGDAASAAQAVLSTGEYDYAWNVQVEPEILEQMATGGKGEVISALRHAGRAHRRQPDRPRSGAGRGALHRRASASVPDRPERRQGAEPRHRPRRSSSRPATARRASRPATSCRRPRPARRRTTTGA